MTVGPTGFQQTRETYTYDPATDLLSAQQVQRGNSALLNLRYTYFGNGQLRQLIEGFGVAYYDYDPLGRLTPVQASIGSVWSEAYAYASIWNKISVTASGMVPDGIPMPLDGLAGTPTPPNGLSA